MRFVKASFLRNCSRLSTRSYFAGISQQMFKPFFLFIVPFFIPLQASQSIPSAPIPIDPNILPGIQTSAAPWPPEIAHLRERLEIIKVPPHPWSDMGLNLHIHEHLDVFVHGTAVTVPANIGISSTPQFLSPLHTHDTSGVIHVESRIVRAFTLGEFFDVWGVRFTAKCIGGYCENWADKLVVYVDGKPLEQDPRDLILKAHQEIVVAFGTVKDLPHPVPAGYKFPSGL